MSEFPLFDLAPRLTGVLPRVRLGEFPTKVERSQPLSSALGCELYVKRDDRAGRIYGGNKVRKQELLLASVQARGRDSIVVSGGLGSNDVLATALHGSEAGFQVIAVLVPQPLTVHAEANLRHILTAASRVVFVPSLALVPAAVAVLWIGLQARGRRPAVLPVGGSSPVGNIGPVNAALELAADVEQSRLPYPDLVVVPLGSGGTVAGLVLGFRLAGLRTRVLGVRVVPRVLIGAGRVRRHIAATAELLARLDPGLARLASRWNGDEGFEVLHDHCGPGLWRPTPESLHAEAAAGNAGLVVDPAYTAKALAALFQLRDRLAGRVVVFWNTSSAVDLSARPQADPASLLGPAWRCRRFFANGLSSTRPEV